MIVAALMNRIGCRPLPLPTAFTIVALLLVGSVAADAEGNTRAGPCPVITPGPTTIPKPEMTYIASPNVGQRDTRVAVDSVVMHTTEVNLQGTLDIFLDRSRSVSSHYVIAENGDIYEMVAPEDMAWHATYYNSRSIGIEMVGFAARRSTWNDDNLGALVDLLSWIYQAYPDIPLVQPTGDAYDTTNNRYDEPGLVAHSQVQPWNKSDPGIYFPWDDVINEVQARLDAAAVPEPSSAALLCGLLVLAAGRRVRSR